MDEVSLRYYHEQINIDDVGQMIHLQFRGQRIATYYQDGSDHVVVLKLADGGRHVQRMDSYAQVRQYVALNLVYCFGAFPAPDDAG